MQLSSMTGFARIKSDFQYQNNKYAWTWEIKSVNAKGLDVKVRLPQWLDHLDGQLKNICSEFFSRGTINAALDIHQENLKVDIQVNEDLLAALSENVQKLYLRNAEVFAKPSPAELLLVNGVVKLCDSTPDEEELKLLQEELCQSFKMAAQNLKKDREREGQKIGMVLTKILEQISAVVQHVEEIAVSMPEKIREKVRIQINELVQDTTVTPERLEQEVLFLIMRADVQEELDRLKAHIKTAQELLQEDVPVGRRLDFLCQEFNREANTLCSKSADIEQTKCGMELKALIEQFREQIQNME